MATGVHPDCSSWEAKKLGRNTQRAKSKVFPKSLCGSPHPYSTTLGRQKHLHLPKFRAPKHGGPPCHCSLAQSLILNQDPSLPGGARTPAPRPGSPHPLARPLPINQGPSSSPHYQQSDSGKQKCSPEVPPGLRGSRTRSDPTS